MSLTVTTETQQGAPHSEEKAPVAVNMVIRQDPFYITLDAAALLAISILLVLGMHFIERLVLELLIILVPMALLIHNDYLNFLKLGPGGTPPTPSGYARLTWYRLFTLRDPFSAPPVDPSQKPAAGILSQLPYRPGPRPVVAGLAPQRQLNQHGAIPSSNRLRAAIQAVTQRLPGDFVTATSCLEKHGFALFARHPVNVCGNGEVCHIHTSDRSMHLNLHPDDIREVLEKGWGQRHPMAWEGWVRSPVPRTFTMIYAPRDENDLKIVCGIIEAAIWYTTARKVDVQLAPES
ncbi:hypothetical protein CHGG_01642 [Chaetomium globosum CBS 148.51]|uniref:Luciferase domain-containing protein n=1 Tax=Chaetomium globosum (strain ATCC 6205 / CBS 148.51 / DSM 1962 / NBRC 6347 / NRRL 1970) TaxID=306901 RepID=Q2HDR2_CHAGB|nr:uncharacterized protein CHGG_01642 [Chaetomium globosum CBS 148.51]EAQ93407.1 hypothetical protein CHGG_01642 [Chaetomium globosum CBS 148.51]